MRKDSDFWAFAAWSAFLAVVSPLLLLLPADPASGFLQMFVSAVWLVVVGIALYRFRRRALWLLLGAPLVLLWPCLIVFLSIACARGDCI